MVQHINPANGRLLEETDEGLLDGQQLVYARTGGVIRVAGESNYAENFGFEWNEFQKTQIDKFSGRRISEERFFTETGWNAAEMAGQDVLEAGSGAGRFTQVVLDRTGAELYSIDYSAAVDANFRNNGPHPRLHLYQASIYELPFAPGSFDKVFCLGVLQHTPDFRKSLEALAAMVKPGGELVVDFYPIRGWYTKLHAKYLLRPLLKNMPHDKLLRLIRRNAGWMIAFTRFNNHIGIGRFINRFVPVCDVQRTLPQGLPPETLKEWVVLDTFDMFSPAYDQPQRPETVKVWMEGAGMEQVSAQYVRYGEEQLVAPVVKGRRPKQM